MSGNVEDAALLDLRLSSFNRLQRTRARRIAPLNGAGESRRHRAPKAPFRSDVSEPDRLVLR